MFWGLRIFERRNARRSLSLNYPEVKKLEKYFLCSFDRNWIRLSKYEKLFQANFQLFSHAVRVIKIKKSGQRLLYQKRRNRTHSALKIGK
jgi:hypothetical protein